MSRTGESTWSMDVQRGGTGVVPLRIAVRGTDVRLAISGRIIVLDVRDLAELIEDLRAAGRRVRAVESMMELVREFRPASSAPPAWSESIFPDGDVADADDQHAPPATGPAERTEPVVPGPREPGRARSHRYRGRPV